MQGFLYDVGVRGIDTKRSGRQSAPPVAHPRRLGPDGYAAVMQRGAETGDTYND